MNIRTIEDNFDYQVKRIIQSLVDDYKETDSLIEYDTEEWLWNNKEKLGEYFFNRISEYMGFDEIIDEIEF